MSMKKRERESKSKTFTFESLEQRLEGEDMEEEKI